MSTASAGGRTTSVRAADGRPDPVRMRRIMGQFVTGVCAVSTRSGGPSGAGHDAIAVNSFTSVSLDPPLVSICLRADSAFLLRIRTAGVWAVSFLGNGARGLVRELTMPSEKRPPVERAASWDAGVHTGCLLLTEGPGSLECATHLVQPLGDHVLVIGRVLGTAWRDEDPLVFHRGAFTEVEQPA